jgi:hypothetical protein
MRVFTLTTLAILLRPAATILDHIPRSEGAENCLAILYSTNRIIGAWLEVVEHQL